MPIIRICDGPDCEIVRPDINKNPEGFYSWLHIEASDEDDYGEFCSWTCLAALATNKAIERESLKIL